MVFSIHKVVLPALLLATTLAIPTDPVALHSSNLHEQSSTSTLGKTGSYLAGLRDAVVAKFWFGGTQRKWSSTTQVGPLPASYQRRYGNDVVRRFTINTEEEANAFANAADFLYLDVWDSSENWTDVRIAKEMLPSFLELLPDSLRHSHKPLIYDLPRAVYESYPPPISSEESSSQFKEIFRNQNHDVFFQNYQPLDVIHNWLRLLTSLFPQIATLTSIGKSAEGRDILALHVGARTSDPSPEEPRHTVLITAGSHAREWIAVSTLTYIAYAVLTHHNNPEYSDLTKILRHYDIIFIPTLNPDGYEYTWTHDRLWRKTRQETSLPFCAGIDLDRSFPFRWDGHDGVDNPCTESYAGTHALESVESQALESWVRNQTQENHAYFESFIDLHSYSQKILYPYSYSCSDEPPTLEDLEEVAMGLAKSFRLTMGHFYSVESACEGAFSFHTKSRFRKSSRVGSEPTAAGGSALDYFYHDLGVKYAYQIKLRDTGSYGFLLPRENILPSGKEAFEAIMGLGRWLLGNRGIESESNRMQETSRVQDDDDKGTSSKTMLGLGLNFGNDHQSPDGDGSEEADDESEWERVYDPELRRRRR